MAGDSTFSRQAPAFATLSRERRPPAVNPRQGEVWYVFTLGQPADPHQRRPAVVVFENIRNRMRDDLIVVPVFSTGREGCNPRSGAGAIDRPAPSEGRLLR